MGSRQTRQVDADLRDASCHLFIASTSCGLSCVTVYFCIQSESMTTPEPTMALQLLHFYVAFMTGVFGSLVKLAADRMEEQTLKQSIKNQSMRQLSADVVRLENE